MSRRSTRKSAIPSYTEASDNDIENAAPELSTKPSPRKRVAKKEVVEKAPVDTKAVEKEGVKVKATPRKRKGHSEEVEAEVGIAKKGKAGAKRKVKEEERDVTEEEGEKKVTKKRKTKEDKEKEAMPLAARTVVAGLKRKMFIGAHISAAGGVQNSINNAVHIGANAFALFLKSQRKWASPAMTAEAQSQFPLFCKEQNYDAAAHILPHGSYLVNLAQPGLDKADQAYACFIDDLHRCEALGIRLYNFHPGNTGAHPRPDAIARIAAQLNRAHRETKSVVTVLENMAGAGNVVGTRFEDLRDIIALIDDKSRVGVCIDTCHVFAAGYDLRSPEAFAATMREFEEVVGGGYLRALHLNDSKTPLGSNRDLHANIGTGFIGLAGFWNVVNHAGFEGLPMVLETPIERKGADGKKFEDKGVWAREIKMLERLIGADFETEEWRGEVERLQEEGRGEREKFEKQVDKKNQKTLDDMFKKENKANGKAKGKAKKKVKEEETDEDSDDSEGGCNH